MSFARRIFLTVALTVALAAALAPGRAFAATGLQVSPSSLSFSRFGERHTVTVTNRGPETLRISKGVLATGSTLPMSGFSVEVPGSHLLRPHVLAPGESLSLIVEFRPMSAQAQRQYFASLKLFTDDTTKPPELRAEANQPPSHLVTVALRGGIMPPMISMIILLPLLGGLAALLLRRRTAAAWAVALGAAGAAAVLAVIALCLFDPTLGPNDVDAGLQLAEHYRMTSLAGIEYHVAADGMSIVMLVLTAVLGVVAMAVSQPDTVARGVRVPALLLLCQAGLTGAFAAQNLGLLAVFWFVALAAAVCLLACGATGRPRAAVAKMALAAAASLILLVLVTVEIARASMPAYGIDGAPIYHDLDLVHLSRAGFLHLTGTAWGLPQAHVLLLELLVAFGMFMPLVPLHGWLRDVMTSAPSGAAIMVGGILSRFGIFALAHVAWRILPQSTMWAAKVIAVAAVASMTYGALAALAQRTLRGLAACSTIAAGGAALLGLSAMTQTGASGALMLTCGHGLAVALLVVIAHVLQVRGRAADLGDLAGTAGSAPRLAVVAGAACLGAAALPGSAGFVGQSLAVVGAFPIFRALACFAAVMAVLAAAAYVGPLGRLFGPGGAAGPVADLDRRELALVAPLAAALLVLGLYPRPLLDALAAAAQATLAPVLPPGSAGLVAALFQ